MKYLRIWPLLLLLVTTVAFSQQRGEIDPRLTALINQRDSIQLQNSLDTLSKSEVEDDLNLLVSYYNLKRNQNKRRHFQAGHPEIPQRLSGLCGGFGRDL